MITSTRRRSILVAVAATVVLGACQAVTPPPTLAGRTFLSVAVTENGAPKALVPGTRITLDFKETSLGVNAGCNHMGGEYTISSAGRLLANNLFTTDMACDAPRMAQDQWLAGVLGSQPRLTQAGDELTIDGGSVVIRLTDRRVVEPDLQLVGPTWTVDSIFSGDTVSSVPQGAVATLVFHDDGTFDVDTGCNTGQGRWAAVAGGLELSAIGLTKKACVGPNDQLEAAVTGVLHGGTIAAEIEARRLILRAGVAGLGLGG